MKITLKPRLTRMVKPQYPVVPDLQLCRSMVGAKLPVSPESRDQLSSEDSDSDFVK